MSTLLNLLPPLKICEHKNRMTIIINIKYKSKMQSAALNNYRKEGIFDA